MAWNEPGNNKDPWGGNKKNDGPPDLGDIFGDLKQKFDSLFGGKGGGSGSGNNGSGGTGSTTGFFVIALVVLALIYVVMGMGIVNEQFRAVVLRLGQYHETKGPGFRWNPPFIDKVFEVNVTRVEGWSTTAQMLTQDLNIVDIKLSVQYIIDDPKNYVLEVKNPIESLHQATNSALRHVAGSTVMHDILTQGREQAAVEVQDRLQRYLDSYKTGIRIETVNIEDSNPPREVQAAFDDVIKAREDEERLKNEAQAYSNGIIPEARGAAQRVIEEAAAYKEQVIAQAEGEAKRFEYLLLEYKKAPKVTRERLYLDAMEQVMQNSSKVLVDIEGGNNMMYLPLDKLAAGAVAKQKMTEAELDELANLDEQERRNATNSNIRSREGR